MLRIVADENIPFVQEAFGKHGTVTCVAGHALSNKLLQEATVLLVRSVTQVNEALLKNTPVAFVGSATTGIDHIDLAYLNAQNIYFSHAPGANAGSVVEYVLAALFALATQTQENLFEKKVGIVGVGQVGSRLMNVLQALGMKVLPNDPLRVKAESLESFYTLEEVLETADIISFHVPLTTSGDYPTYHMLHEKNIQTLKKGAWLINTSRGGVIETQALKQALKKQILSQSVLDVWENEPHLDIALLKQVSLATPHIAGYSYEGKTNGTKMIYDAFCAYFGCKPHEYQKAIQLPHEVLNPPTTAAEIPAIHALLQQMYPILADHQRLLEKPFSPTHFIGLRKNYPKRFTFSRFQLPATVPKTVKQHLETIQELV